MPKRTSIERIARALCRYDGNPEDVTTNGQPKWRSYIGEATVALKAIREPTEAMTEAIVDVPPDRPHANYWRAGIDAALAELP